MGRYAPILLISLGLLGGPLPAALPPPTVDEETGENAQDSPAEAALSASAKALEAAIARFEKLPLGIEARLDRYRECEDLFQKIVEDQQGSEEKVLAIFYRSQCQRHLGRYSPAIEGFNFFLQARNSGDHVVDALFGLGISSLKLQEWQGGLVAFQRIFKEFPSESEAPIALYQGGYCQRELGQFDEARGLWQQLLRKFPTHAYSSRARELLGSLRPPIDRLREALPEYLKAVKEWRTGPYQQRRNLFKGVEEKLKAIGEIRCKESERFLRDLVSKETKELQAAAIAPLLSVGGKDTGKLLLGLLEKVGSQARLQILRKLLPRHLRGSRLSQLESQVKSPEIQISLAAIELLGRIGTIDAVQLMVAAIPDAEDDSALSPTLRRRVDQIGRELRGLRDSKTLAFICNKVVEPKRGSPLARSLGARVLGVAGYQDAVDVLVGLLRETRGDVAISALDALGRLKSQDSLEAILRWIRRRGGDVEFQKAGVKAMAQLDPTSGEGILLQLGNHPDFALRTLVLRALAKIDSAASIKRRVEGLEDPAWQVRTAAVQSLKGVRDSSVVDGLIGSLERESGALEPQIVEILIELTGVDLGPDAGPWEEYWQSRRGKFAKNPVAGSDDSPKGRTFVRKADPKAARSPSYFGVEIVSRRLAFIVDVSGSMSSEVSVPQERGGNQTMRRIDLAKDELLRVLDKLRPGTYFNLVRFESGFSQMVKKPIKLSPKSMKRARGFVHGLQPGGGGRTSSTPWNSSSRLGTSIPSSFSPTVRHQRGNTPISTASPMRSRLSTRRARW